MLYLLEKGGIVIYPLLGVSVISLMIILERIFVFLRTPIRFPEGPMDRIKELLDSDRFSQAIGVCQNYRGPAARVLERGIASLHGSDDPDTLDRVMEEIKWEEFPRLEKRLEVLNFMGKISPTLGLLGTVTGMIRTFQVLSINGSPQQLAGGISEALITTAVGLVISIPVLGAYQYFINRIQSMLNHTEKRQIELINFLEESSEHNEQRQKSQNDHQLTGDQDVSII